MRVFTEDKELKLEEEAIKAFRASKRKPNEAQEDEDEANRGPGPKVSESIWEPHHTDTKSQEHAKYQTSLQEVVAS